MFSRVFEKLKSVSESKDTKYSLINYFSVPQRDRIFRIAGERQKIRL